jgi:hypothetical protein
VWQRVPVSAKLDLIPTLCGHVETEVFEINIVDKDLPNIMGETVDLAALAGA